ncbi:MAG: MFS transporter, partial [Candidatus Liptonbacteria bacterium]|nr:MFS transporter [Candidatus Liptonbacteria bacterium]
MKLPVRVQFNLDFSVGKVVRFFVLSDLLLISGWGLVSPVFAVFVKDSITGATLITVGIGASIYWIVRSIIQMPIAYYLDKLKGEKDDFYVLIGGFLIVSFAAFAFMFVTEIWQFYVVQFFHAVGFGMYVPAWTGIFSRHVDRDHSAFMWSLDNTVIGLASGVTGVFGGILAQEFGFSVVFFLAGLFTLFAALIVFAVPDLIFPRIPATGISTPLRDHTVRTT